MRRRYDDLGGEMGSGVFGCLLGIFIPILLFLILKFDYVMIGLFTWLFVFGANGANEQALLADVELHTVFIILIFLAIFAVWFGIQQIRIFEIYVFRILASIFASFSFTMIFVVHYVDTIWAWAIGIILFLISLGAKSMKGELRAE